jgi:uncharacterized SAM-binding protein YcdF (DUF218 family)
MSSFISPLFYFWIFLLCALLFYKLKRIKACKVFVFIAVFQLFVLTVTPLPVAMVRGLEQKYDVYTPRQADTKLPVLVLGAGHVNDPDLPALQRLSIPVLDRVAEGIRIQNINKGKIVFSGFSRKNKSPHAIAMAEAAVSMGVNPADTVMLVRPSNTWEEAAAYKKRFGSEKRFVLVTSAVHMPRAVAIFKSIGMEPIAAPANFLNRNEPEANAYNWWPSSMKSMYTEIAIYEYFSTWYYRNFKEDDIQEKDRQE